MQINDLDSGEALGFWEVAQSTGYSSAQATWMPPIPARKLACLSLRYALRSIERTGSAWGCCKGCRNSSHAYAQDLHEEQPWSPALTCSIISVSWSLLSAREEKRTGENQCSCLMWTNDLPFGPQYSHGHPYKEILRFLYSWDIKMPGLSMSFRFL